MAKSIEQRLTQHDREIAAIRKLVLQGMKILVRIENQALANEQQIRKLAAAQMATGKKLQRLIDSRSSNGRH
jgi:hypothetical protein